MMLMTFIEIIQMFISPAVISTLGTLFINRYFSNADKKRERQDNVSNRLQILEEKQEKNDAINELVNVLDDKLDKLAEKLIEHEESYQEFREEITSQLAEKGRLLEAVDEVMLILNNALKAILKREIIQMYNEFFLDKGYMPLHDRESLESMFKEYENLGGNGTVKSLTKKMYKLPSEPVEQ